MEASDVSDGEIVAAIDGVVNEVPVPNDGPPAAPVAFAYQLNMPAVTLLAANTTVPGPQVEPGVVVGTAGTAFTVAITAFRGELSQLPLLNVT